MEDIKWKKKDEEEIWLGNQGWKTAAQKEDGRINLLFSSIQHFDRESILAMNDTPE